MATRTSWAAVEAKYRNHPDFKPREYTDDELAKIRRERQEERDDGRYASLSGLPENFWDL